MKIRILTIPFLLAPLACAPDRDGAPSPATVTRDSAGIHIVENAPPGRRLAAPLAHRTRARGLHRSPRRRRTLHASLRHGCHEAARRADRRGKQWVARVKGVQRRGNPPGYWGGRGEGPGEFLELWRVERWPGDSIAAWYAPRLGMSVFGRGRDLRAHLLAGGGRRAVHLRRPRNGRLGSRNPPSRRWRYPRRPAQGW